MTLPPPGLIAPPCPACGHPLHGLATKCWTCGALVGDAKPKTQPKPVLPPREEEDIRLGIVDVLKLQGFAVWNLSQARASKQSEGLADLFVTGAGATLWVEVKRPSGEQSADQRIFEAHVIGNGGRYLVWRDESEAVAWCRMVRGGEA